ncbi:hypothetical protein QE152_g27700 [Popillia japonica]|uniref:COMM domain-containing protein 4 n=1 Tax=Popillia japonica TaxID=7064 RepID=A0AAW1JVE1_POPJA
MKFRFCGDADCPDWVLVEINILSTLSSVKLKLLAQVVANGIINPPIDMTKAEKLFADSKLDLDLDLKACVACLSFIITSTVGYNCDRSVLHSELQQLGLPREHSTSIRRVTDDNYGEIAAKLAASSLKINPLQKCNIQHDKNTNIFEVSLEIGNNPPTNILITPFTLDVLLENLKSVRSTMKELHENPYVL